MVDRRYREEFTPFYFDLVVNDEALALPKLFHFWIIPGSVQLLQTTPISENRDTNGRKRWIRGTPAMAEGLT